MVNVINSSEFSIPQSTVAAVVKTLMSGEHETLWRPKDLNGSANAPPHSTPNDHARSLTVTELRMGLHGMGYRPVPVTGPDARDCHSPGKAPRIKDWPTLCAEADEAVIRGWSRRYSDHTNTGILCGQVIAIDIDVMDEGLVSLIEELARKSLGATPLHRIGRSPKSLLVYRTSQPFRKIRTEFVRSGEDDSAIEILADGQQFVAFGIHPGTRKPYAWQERSPVDTPITDLPLTTEVAVRAFLRDAAGLAVRAGYTVRSKEAERVKANNSGADSYTFDDIVDAFWHIPNDNLHYDDWIRLGMALKAAVGETGQAIWMEWSAQSSKNKPEVTARKWESDFNKVSELSAGTIIYEAKQHGWRGEAKQGSPKTEVLKSINAAQVKMQAVEWIWPNRFAVGKLGILAGMPDEGKGQILCFIAAAITNGGLWPCNEGVAPKGKIVLLTAEDDLADTVVPRLAAAGADLSRVEIVQMVGRNETGDTKKERMFNLVTDLNMLQRKLIEIGDVRMVMIDPITAYMGVKQMDSFKITDVRAVLGPVVQLAAELRVSFLAVMHFNKKTDVNNALLRISDSLAYGATARHVYCAINDEEHDRKLLVKAKNNLAKYNQQSLAYHFNEKKVGFDETLQKEIRAPFVEWEKNTVAITANEAMAAAAATGRVDGSKIAEGFLKEFLAEGPRPQKVIEEEAKQRGISLDQLKRARKKLDSWSEREGFGRGGKWVWGLSHHLRPSLAQAELAGV